MDVIYIFNGTDQVQGTAVPIELQHTEEAYSLYAQVPGNTVLGDGWGIGFQCVDGRFRIFDILTRTEVEPDGYIEISATDRAVRELMDEPIEDRRPQNLSVSAAVERLIADTRYSLGTVSCANTGSMTAYYESVWEALETARTAFEAEIIPYYTFTGGAVTARKIDILSRLGEYRGRIFELGDDLSGIRIKYDDSQIKTALYGRGRGVEIDNGDGNDPSFGRRLTFADVVWTTAGGKPVNKPKDQEWIGDPDALATFGRDGRHRYGFAIFEDCEDPDDLIQKTWDQLQKQKVPLINIEATALDTERVMGRTHEAVRLGDDILIRIAKKHLDISARVIGIVRDYIRPEQTKLTIGNAELTAGGIIKSIQQKIDNYSSKASVWDRAKAFDLQGAMDVMNNQITSSVGHWYTDDSGAIMFVTADGTKAMRLTGAGWQIASQKIGGVWQWRTAATGSGIVADEITTGTLNAGLVTVGGTGTTLDGTSIEVKHPTISNTAKTLINAGGMQILNANSLLGGIVALNGVYTAVMQALYNVSYPNLKVDLGVFSGIQDALYGMLIKYAGSAMLKLGYGFIEGSVVDTEIVSEKGLIIKANDDSISLDAPNASITIDYGGDIRFYGTHNGQSFSVSLYDVYRLID